MKLFLDIIPQFKSERGGRGMGKRGPKPQGLSVAMRKAAFMLGQGNSVKEVAAETKKTEQAIRDWKKRPDFAALVNDECNKWLASLKPQAIAFLKKQLKAAPLDPSVAYIGQNAANSLMNHAARLEQSSASQLTVTFAGGMPEPKMPTQAAADEEQGDGDS
jgi:hypothetical protein